MRKHTAITIALILAAIVTHLFKLAALPAGLNVDEAGMAYDAWSLANYGVDRYLNSYPVYLINYGGGQSALYAYLAAICIKLFGFSTVSIRIPAFIFGIITVICGTLIISKSKICEKSYAALPVMAALYLVMPYFVMSSRFGLDCNLMLGTSTLAIYMILKAARSGQIHHYILAGICSGLILYTYAISYIIVPVFLLFVFVIMLIIRRIDFGQALAFIIPLAIMGIPLVLVQYVNMNGLPAMHIGSITITALTFYRATEFHVPTFDSLLEALKATFMYDWLDYNTNETYGTIYYISIPFAAIGLIVTIRNAISSFKSRSKRKEKELSPDVLILIWFAIMVVIGSMLGGDGPNANRLNGIFYAILYLVTVGIVAVIGFFKNEIQVFAAVALVVIYGVFAVSFYKYYYVDNADHQYYLFQKQLDSAIDYVSNDPDLCGQWIYIVHNNQPYVPPYIYYMLATKIDPYTYNLPETGTSNYANYIFDAPEEINPDGVYIIYEGNDDYIELLNDAGLTNVQTFDGATVVY